MSNKIFENYVNKCPVCGAELDSNSKYCAYCGANLEDLNVTYHEAEQQIHEARADIQEAKEKIQEREAQFKAAKKSNKNIWKKIVIVALCLFIGQFVLAIGVSLIFSAVEVSFEKDKEEFCAELLNEDVDTITAKDFNVNDYEFVGYGKSNIAGELLFSDDYLSIPMRTANYENTCIMQGEIIVDREGLEEIYTFKDDEIGMYFEDYRLRISTDIVEYYDKSTDFLYMYEREDFDNIKRCDDFVVGDVKFECFVDYSYSTEEYKLIANPFRDCFIVIDIENRNYDKELDFEDVVEHIKLIEVDHTIQ